MPNDIKIKLISHACLQIYGKEFSILCDPWIKGTCFNDGWGLRPQPDLEKIDYDKITHIWISHEHPDHLHFPSLKIISTKVDTDKIQILFQKTNSNKIFNALRKFGFKNFIGLNHMKKYQITKDLEVFLYGHRHIDSCLGLISNGNNLLLNINDAELNETDCNIITNKFGSFPLLFNQFSIAGFDGVEDRKKLENEKRDIIQKCITHHKLLGAKCSIPFASFMYFCNDDNKFLNKYSNTVFDFKNAFSKHNLNCALVKHGSQKISLDEISQTDHSSYYRKLYKNSVSEYISSETIPLQDCVDTFTETVSKWKKKTNKLFYKNLKPISFFLEDINTGIICNFQEVKVEKNPEINKDNCNILINCQPFYFSFKYPYGIQTLGVSGRYKIIKNISSWKYIRIISSLANQEIYIGFSSILNKNVFEWIWERKSGLIGQIQQQFIRFSKT
jgi:UDP-MurNAc hydroxylase